MFDVILVQPPFARINMPTPSLSTIKAVLNRNNISSMIFYANFLFIKYIKPDLYEKLCLIKSNSLAAEWVFATAAFPSEAKRHDEYVNKIISEGGKLQVPMLDESVQIDDIIETKQFVEPYLKLVTNEIIEKKPKIVGFSSLFQTNCASIAIANSIKKSSKEIITVLGGGNCLKPMNEAIAQIAQNIDYIFAGEAEYEFREFCNQIVNKNEIPKKRLINCSPVEDLNQLPIPDFDDYFIQLKENNIEVPINLSIESSRGCWWGEKKNCLFCGLNSYNMKYRQKSPMRILEELNIVMNKYKPVFIQFTDNIMPKNIHKKLFTHFKKPKGFKTIFYETKPILKFETLYKLEKAGVNALQPGLESLNDHLLKLLRKGLNTANNIRFLRDCCTIGIKTDWNILYAIPGEKREDYEEIMKIIPKLFHLKPPAYTGSILLQRYSPLFNDPDKYNITNIEPDESYSYIYPKNSNFKKLSLYFNCKFDTIFNKKLKKGFIQLIEEWQESWQKEIPPILQAIKINEEFYLIEDTRPVSKQKARMVSNDYYRIIEFMRLPVLKSNVEKFIEDNKLTSQLEQLMQWEYITESNNRYISLICEPIRIIELDEKYTIT